MFVFNKGQYKNTRGGGGKERERDKEGARGDVRFVDPTRK
jgi:hypothetical protein